MVTLINTFSGMWKYSRIFPCSQCGECFNRFINIEPICLLGTTLPSHDGLLCQGAVGLVSQRFRPATGCGLCEAGRLALLLPPRSRQLSPSAWHWPRDGDVAAARVLCAPSILQVPARLLVEEPGGAACKAPQSASLLQSGPDNTLADSQVVTPLGGMLTSASPENASLPSLVMLRVLGDGDSPFPLLLLGRCFLHRCSGSVSSISQSNQAPICGHLSAATFLSRTCLRSPGDPSVALLMFMSPFPSPHSRPPSTAVFQEKRSVVRHCHVSL